jgi:hypothetical protein
MRTVMLLTAALRSDASAVAYQYHNAICSMLLKGFSVCSINRDYYYC